MAAAADGRLAGPPPASHWACVHAASPTAVHGRGSAPGPPCAARPPIAADPPAHLPPCSAILAHYLLGEKLNMFGALGCILCITGSLAIVLHAPEERLLTSVVQVWYLAMQPGGCRREPA